MSERVLKISQPSTFSSRASEREKNPRVKTVLAGKPLEERGWNCVYSRLVVDGELFDSRPSDRMENPS